MSHSGEALGPDDSQRIRAAAEEPVSDAEKAISGLRVAVLAHEAADAWRWRLAWFVFLTLLALGGWLAERTLADASASATDHQRIEDMSERVVRIEQQIDRLVERTDRQ